jgi:hypothetical protein
MLFFCGVIHTDVIGPLHGHWVLSVVMVQLLLIGHGLMLCCKLFVFTVFKKT